MKIAALLILASAATSLHATDADPTETLLDRCLAQKSHASTAGQTGCETAAGQAYDRRMNTAFSRLVRILPPEAAAQLRTSQRLWLAFRDAEGKARTALYETRRGTMFVPMEAANQTRLGRDRAMELEAYVRAMAID